MRYFVVPSVLVGKYCFENHQGWIKNFNYHPEDSDKRTFRVSLEDNGRYSVETPKASQFEDAWNLLS